MIKQPLKHRYSSDSADDSLLHQEFERQAISTPDNIAVIFATECLTYNELDQRANCVAAQLTSIGVKPDQAVAICVKRSLELLVGILGILKAGAAYLPLDPLYPIDRLHFMLQDARVSVLLTHEPCMDMFTSCACQTISLNPYDYTKQNKPTNLHQPKVQPNNLAYIIYTSGSSGKPKGVMIEHRSITSRLKSLLPFYSLKADDICIHYRSYSYDASIEELLLPLLIGGRVLIAPPDQPYNLVERLIELVYEHKITTINIMPSLLLVFLDYISAHNKSEHIYSLRRIIAGGEPLSTNIVKKFFELSNIALYHMYGPTEASIDAIANKIESFNNQTIIPIGKPLPNTEIYILNKKRKPVKICQIGELYLGGKGIARGYLYRPKLTKTQFLRNPFTTNIGEKIYKTGDLVRELPDGNIEFIGRIDTQVKVRGYRIEIDEINSCLQQIPSVKAAKVIIKGDSISNKHLAAYLICKNKTAITAAMIRKHLAKKLPEHMLPSQYVFIDQFPTLPSGKIDYAALAKINQKVNRKKTNKVTTNSHNEDIIINIWSKILEIPAKDINKNDDFFRIGGASLTAIQMINNINTRYYNRLTITDVLNNPTVCQLAALMDSKDKTCNKTIERIDDRAYYPLSYPQELMWLHQQLNPRIPFYNEAITINIHDKINVALMEWSICLILNRHELLRCRINLKQGKPYLATVNQVNVPFKYIDLRNFQQDKRIKESNKLATDVLCTPFRFNSELLIKFMLIQLNDKHFKLFILAHHCISDAISMFYVLIPELEKIYFSKLRMEKTTLDPIKYRYRDYVMWQRNLLATKDYSAHKTYWKIQLANLQEIRFPFANYSYELSLSGKLKLLHIAQPLVHNLKLLSKQIGTTLFTTLLSAFVALVYRYSSQNDIAIGTVVAGRELSELQNIFGNFLNTIIIRTKVYGDQPFLKLLRSVRKTAIEAYKSQDLPFQEILKITKLPRRKNSYLPFQLAFIYEPKSPESPHGWDINQTEIHNGTSKFDLMFGLEEKQDGMIVRAEYNTDIFADHYIEQFINSYLVMLTNIAENPQQRIDEIPLLNNSARKIILDDWNKTDAPYNNNINLYEQLAHIVTTHPHNTALRLQNTCITYSKLISLVNIAATQLNKYVSYGEVVPICCERNCDLIITILAILKIGAIYTPLKEDSPNDRILSILKDCNANIVIADNNNFARLKDLIRSSSKLFNIKNLIVNSSNKTDTSSHIHGGQHPAYIIYTSGTTGKPKGVIQTHRTINNLINWQSKQISDKKIQRIACFADTAFDVFIQEIFYALLNGYELCIVPEAIKHSFSDLIKYIEKNKIDVLFLPTSMLEYLAECFIKHGANIQYPKYIIVAGEQLEIIAPIRQMFAKYYNTILINQYGPSETHVVTSYQLEQNSKNWNTIPPIGKPINNNKVYVLNKALQLMPIGVIGELYISGENLSLGYVNDSIMTKNKFIPNPFNKTKNELMYKTGDLVKWTPEGPLKFVGRIDDQIKINGMRIELSEIKNVIAGYSKILDCEILTNKAGKSNQIVAYVVFQDKQEKSIEPLKDICKAKLPHYMLPQRFIILEKLPLNRNGKTDRAKLLDMLENKDHKNSIKAPQIPKTKLQNKLATLWQKILGLANAEININDDFFDLGGHSLAVLQFIFHLKEQFNIEIKFCEFAQVTTIAKLEAYIKNIYANNIEISYDPHKEPETAG